MYLATYISPDNFRKQILRKVICELKTNLKHQRLNLRKYLAIYTIMHGQRQMQGYSLSQHNLCKQSFLDHCPVLEGQFQCNVLPQTNFSKGYNPPIGKTILACSSHHKQTFARLEKMRMLWQQMVTAVFSFHHIPYLVIWVDQEKIILLLNSSLSKAAFLLLPSLLFPACFLVKKPTLPPQTGTQHPRLSSSDSGQLPNPMIFAMTYFKYFPRQNRGRQSEAVKCGRW